MDKLVLPIPDHFVAPSELGLEPSAERLQQWLSELPLVNADHSIGQLSDVLTRVNQAELEPSHRFELLKLIYPVAEKLADTLRDKYVRALLPLHERQYWRYHQVQDLNAALAAGFKIVMNSLLEGGRKGDHGNRMLFSCGYLALHHLALVLVETYTVYFPEPVHVWREINNLYRFAENRGALHVPASREELHRHTPTMALAYKRIVLLALANPYHLMQGEAHSIYKLAFKLAPGCRIHHRRQDPDRAYFFVDLRADAGPRFAPADHEIQALEPQFFEMEGLLEAVQARVRELESGESDGVQELPRYQRRQQADMLRRLVESWGRSQDRQEERYTQLGNTRVVIGLSGTHSSLTGGAPFLPELDEIRIHTGRSLDKRQKWDLVPLEHEPWRLEEAEERLESGVQTPRASSFDTNDHVSDVWEKIYATKVRREAESDPSLETGGSLAIPWEKKNESQGGVCLYRRTASGMPVRVGEVVAFEPQESTSQDWAIGIIRWIHVLDNESVQTGVKLIGSSAQGLAVRSVGGVGQGGEYFRALVTPAQSLDSEDSVLVVPATIYDTDTRLAVNLGDEIRYVRLTELLHSNQSVAQFRFDVIERPDSESENINQMRELL